MIYCIKTSRFHEGCLMYIFLAVIAILFLIFVAVSIRAKNGSRIYKPTKRDIEKEADEKYNRISGGMQQKLLRKRKSSLKASYITITSLFFVLSSACIGVMILHIIKNDILLISLSILFLILSIIFATVLPFKLKQNDKILIIQQLRKNLKKTYNSLTPKKVKTCKSYVKQNSDMYKNIQKLNSEYAFDRNTCRIYKYYEQLNTKRQFDNFNYDKWISTQIDNRPTFFSKLKDVYEKSETLYQEYLKQYYKLRKYKSEIETENSKLDYETFNYIEKELFNECILPSITKPSIDLEISYTSPSGRNHYSDRHTYSYLTLLNKIQLKKEREDMLLSERLKKEQLAAARKEKNAKLKNLDKKEKELAKKEAEIIKKEKEFLEATKEHIYTIDTNSINIHDAEINDTMTLTQKMKILKEKFNKGELTYEEYQEKRKEII